MALDLSPKRHGSKADPSEKYVSGEEIMAEADRIAQVKKDAKIIAQEIISELDKREAAEEDIMHETTAIDETTESIVVPASKTQMSAALTNTPIIYIAIGFILGVLVTSLFFIIKIKHIKQDSERW